MFLVEKLAAISSPYAHWITDLDRRFVSGCDDGINTLIRWNVDRGNQFRGLAQVAYCIERLPLGEDVYVTTAKLSSWLHQENVPGQQLKDTVTNVLKRFWVLANNSATNRAFSSSKKIVSPVEFTYFSECLLLGRQPLYSCSVHLKDVLIAILYDCQDAVIAHEMHELRVEVRKRCGDRHMQTNTNVIAVFWELIHKAEDRCGIKRKRQISESDEYTLIADRGGQRKKRQTGR